jgi:enoyl-[acyl-carrier protein] reductase I
MSADASAAPPASHPVPDTAPRVARGTLMAGKRGMVMGVANDRSIAWGIAAACAAQGAEIAFTYQGEALEKRVRPLAESVGSSLVLPCDVGNEESIDVAFAAVEKAWGKIDFLVHAIGWADKAYLRGRYLDTPRAAFLQALDISCYSFVAVSQRAARMMNDGGSLLTLTYLGAERVMPHYNVMGVAKAALEASVRYLAADLGERNIRVNAISAGPIKTLAASGIGDFRYILKWNELNAPLTRNVTTEEVGGSGLYLLSDLSAGVTGEVHHVDCGYHIVGMKNPAAPDIASVIG